MALPSTLASWLKSLPIPWLVSRDNGANDCNAQGAVYDDQVEQLREAVKARMPLSCPADALPAIGSDRQLIQGVLETDDDFRARCKAVWNQWELAGTWAELLFQLYFSCGFPAAQVFIVQQNGLVYNLSANPGPTTDPTTLLQVNQLGLNYSIGDGAGYPWWTFDARDDLCARFAIIVDSGWQSFAFSGSDAPSNIYGFSDKDIYAVGANGKVAHFDGVSWTSQAIGAGHALLRVYGDAPNSVWAVGNTGSIYRSTDGGITWGAPSGGDPTSGAHIYGVWSIGADVWILTGTLIVFHSTDSGATWDAGHTLSGGLGFGEMIGGTSASNVFAACGNGYAYWNGSAWTEVLYSPTGSRRCMVGIGDNKWIVGNGNPATPYSGISRIHDGYATTTQETTTGIAELFTWAHGISDTNLYAVTFLGEVVRRESDGTWSLFRETLASNLTGVWVSPSGYAWVTSGTLSGGKSIYSHAPLNAALIAQVVKTWKPAKARYMGLVDVAQGDLWGWPVGLKWGAGGLKWGSSHGIHVGT